MNTFREYVEWLKQNEEKPSFRQWCLAQGLGAPVIKHNITFSEEELWQLELLCKEPELAAAEERENRADNSLRLVTYNFLAGMTENAHVYFKTDQETARKLFTNVGLKEYGSRLRKARHGYASDTLDTSYDSPNPIQGFQCVGHVFALDSDKPFIHAVRRQVILNSNSQFNSADDLFEKFVYDTNQVILNEICYNNYSTFQGFPLGNSEHYKGFRSVALPLLQQIAGQEIPAIFYGRSVGSGFCLVNP